MAPDPDVKIDRLGTYLEQHIASFRGLISATRLKGGNSNPTYRLDAHSGCYVLRRRPAGNLLPSAHAIHREFGVLSALQGTSIPVPKPLHFADDSSLLGSS